MLQAYFSLRCGEYVGILRRLSTAFDQDLPVCIFLSEPKDFVSLYIGIRAVGLAKEHVYDVSVDPFKSLAYFDPIFFLIDGFRYGFLDAANSNIMTGLLVSGGAAFLASAGVWFMLRSGYKLKA